MKLDGNWTYRTQLAEERAEIGATRTAELFFEEIEVDDDVRYCVFVYLLDGSIREEVLYPCRRQSQASLPPTLPIGRWDILVKGS